MIIAIDGYSSTGKSTLAKKIAKVLKISYVDSGAMYRAVTFYAINNQMFNGDVLDCDKLIKALNKIEISFKINPETHENETYLNHQNIESQIRDVEVSNKVSIVAKLPEVRSFLVKQQQKMAKNNSLVMDGRDIGTVVFPEADIKLFITSTPEIRAQRRHLEMQQKGIQIDFDEVLTSLTERDLADTTREFSPLTKAQDAIEVDNSLLTKEQTLEKCLEIIQNQTQTNKE